MYDAAIVGGGLSGVATAMLLQSKGLRTIVVESHSRLGGCAGFYSRTGFSFDVGATTLVDFHPEGLGGQFLRDVGAGQLEIELLPGYQAWLPDRTVNVAKDQKEWSRERALKCGSSPRHLAFWKLLDEIAECFWNASRRGAKLPMRGVSDMLESWRALGLSRTPMAKYIGWSLGDALRHFELDDEAPLKGLLSMMVEDTVHAKLTSAPLINAAMGISIRGAGLARPKGGMRGFWRCLTKRYVELGGVLKLRTHATRIDGSLGRYKISARNGVVHARQVVCALPLEAASRIAQECLGSGAQRFIERDAAAMGGGLVLCLGVRDTQISDVYGHRHHQLLQSYEAPLGEGNNMFISVSAADDRLSAPDGWRAVMISTHCELDRWNGLTEEAYRAQKVASVKQLLKYAHRVYPQLGEDPLVCELGTPRTYAHFANRPRGAVGGARLNMTNSNRHAVPYDLGREGFWLAGDSTWPGLGTVACVIGAKHVVAGVIALSKRVSCGRAQRTVLLPRGA